MQTSILLAIDQQSSIQAGNNFPVHLYTPYGYRAAQAGPLLAFTGEPRASLPRCYLLGNGKRAYDTVLMRFQRPDIFSPFGRGGLNSYAYCQGDPVNNVDRDGHSITRVIGQFLGSMTGTVGMFSSLVKAAKNIVRRSKANINNQPVPEEFDSRSRRNNAIVFNTGLVSTALKVPGIAAAFGFPAASRGAEVLTSAGIVTAGVGGAAKFDQLIFDSTRTIKTARELRLPLGTLLRASVMEASGWYLLRGKESPLIASRDRVVQGRARFRETSV
ncbi:RHS repeat-associated core domain-containing protein [Pseudomonas asiatica]|uniref:RHS repeat-associated core domain-containing protein n=1 Tax=Pseudomonas asiatica TaxID=2219225 RepID=A0A9X4DDE6_9PSED|nr:RHS repeat-associated core domain-containing protein [Pseudomonas asiatica]MEE1902921.1 RHS repeat-associated core domain-containing protein [Pseudomonas inefficax]MDD2114025.1 RHS repeat-associated core domain-containing protein [Pseudomonas asiatica]MEE1908183.1 RHS repeat-associated core domain-containing protein [Pseudomonas inefficax]MEE1985983.1 RHS repeat-associated core domain-containing protein [Pseudomonas inefficax]WJN49896.1 RHS repeat-associated core domain-containing protein [